MKILFGRRGFFVDQNEFQNLNVHGYYPIYLGTIHVTQNTIKFTGDDLSELSIDIDRIREISVVNEGPRKIYYYLTLIPPLIVMPILFWRWPFIKTLLVAPIIFILSGFYSFLYYFRRKWVCVEYQDLVGENRKGYLSFCWGYPWRGKFGWRSWPFFGINSQRDPLSWWLNYGDCKQMVKVIKSQKDENLSVPLHQ